MTLEEVVKALDAKKLEVKVIDRYGVRWWRVRRNGATKTWKTRPGHFRIPLKAGLRLHGEICHDSNFSNFRVAE